MQYTYNQLLELLKELNDVFKAKNKYVTLNIYGGFVMCAYALRYATEDIDAVFMQSEEEVEDAIKLVSKRRKIEGNWLNSAVKDVVFQDMIKEDLTLINLGLTNMMINFPRIDQLLAMKLYSARMSKDLNDAVMLAKKIGITNEMQLDIILKQYFILNKIRERNKSHGNIIGRFRRAVIEKLKELYERGC
ncbi:MAG: hypothetical protein AB1815_01295 [Bacillota bacterium]